MEQSISEPPIPSVSPSNTAVKKITFGTIVFLLVFSLITAVAALFAYDFYTKKPNQVVLPSAIPSPIVLVSPSPESTTLADWETYTNKKLNYSFAYPSDWTIEEGTDGIQVYLKKIDLDQEKVTMPGDTLESARYQIHIWPRENPNNLSAKEFYLSQFDINSRTKAEQSLQKINIVGEEGILYDEGTAPASGPEKAILIKHGTFIYGFFYGAMAYPETHLKFYDAFNQILSTFKFTE